ncbi:hypothetical protein [Providencia rettgeri]|uniref:hypothetical protein n=1 Tax=Providencia rettgeri TaxID=587 RepID=UPI000D7DE733|nr:hypothetical protein AM461_07915 [Providencia rettgeri]
MPSITDISSQHHPLINKSNNSITNTIPSNFKDKVVSVSQKPSRNQHSHSNGEQQKLKKSETVTIDIDTTKENRLNQQPEYLARYRNMSTVLSLLKKAVYISAGYAMCKVIYSLKSDRGINNSLTLGTEDNLKVGWPLLNKSGIAIDVPPSNDARKYGNELAYQNQQPTEKNKDSSESQLLTQDNFVKFMGENNKNDNFEIKTVHHILDEIVIAQNKVEVLFQPNVMQNKKLDENKWQFIRQTLGKMANEVAYQREELVIRGANDAANYFSGYMEEAKIVLPHSLWDEQIPLPASQGRIALLLRDLGKCNLTWLNTDIDLNELNSKLNSINERSPKEGLFSLTTNEMLYFANVFNVITKNHKNVRLADANSVKGLTQAYESFVRLHKANEDLNGSYQSIKNSASVLPKFGLNDWKSVMKTLMDFQDRNARTIERELDASAKHLSIYLEDKGKKSLGKLSEINGEYAQILNILAELDNEDGDIRRLVKNSDSMMLTADQLLKLSSALKNKKPTCIQNEYIEPCSS